MRFRLIDAAKKEFPVQRLCKVLGVSQSGYFAWKDRPACRRQNEDMVLLAHIRSAFALSNATYGVFFHGIGTPLRGDFHPIGTPPRWVHTGLQDSGRPRLECWLWRRSPRYAGRTFPLVSRSRRSAASCTYRARLCGRSFARTPPSSITNVRANRFPGLGLGDSGLNPFWRRTRARRPVSG